MAVSNNPTAQRDAFSEQAWQFVAPDFAVARQKIERMSADADFEDFTFVAQLLLERVFRHLHFCQDRGSGIPCAGFGEQGCCFLRQRHSWRARGGGRCAFACRL